MAAIRMLTAIVMALTLALALTAPAAARVVTVPAVDEWNLPAGQRTLVLPDEPGEVFATNEWNLPIYRTGAKGGGRVEFTRATLRGAPTPDEWHLGALGR